MGDSKQGAYRLSLEQLGCGDVSLNSLNIKCSHITIHSRLAQSFSFYVNDRWLCYGYESLYPFPYILTGNSVVFKQESPFYEHFYKNLIPNVHYIPIERDLSDLVEKIQWAMNNDNKALIISQNGQQFARDNLLPTNILCYHVKLLQVITQILNTFSLFLCKYNNLYKLVCFRNGAKMSLVTSKFYLEWNVYHLL